MISRILVIAGSDSGGGAGIQADIKTITMLGGHAMTAITAVTAQNSVGVQAVHVVPADIIVEQIASVVEDLGVDAIKIGMLPTVESVRAVAAALVAAPQLGAGSDATRKPGAIPIALDPVLVATSGDALASDDVTAAILAQLLPLATIVTPNLPELIALGGRGALLDRGAAILCKGGHADSDTAVDLLIEADGSETVWSAPWIDTPHTHGTGCTLASAIAVYLARGSSLKTAVARARQFVRMALHDAPGLGHGHGPMGHGAVRLDLGPGARLNQVTVGMTDYAASRDFYATLGLKQIVATDDAHYARFEAAGGATLSIESGAAPTVFFECEDLDGEVARLRAAGLVFEQLPAVQDWLWREARLRDPAGNAVCLYQADENRRFPPWRIDARL